MIKWLSQPSRLNAVYTPKPMPSDGEYTWDECKLKRCRESYIKKGRVSLGYLKVKYFSIG